MDSVENIEALQQGESSRKPDRLDHTSQQFSCDARHGEKPGLPRTPSSATGYADIEKEALVKEKSNEESLEKRDFLTLQRTVTPAAASIALPIAPQPEATYPEGGLRAWLVVFGSFSGMFACFGLMNTVGTIEAYVSTHQLADYDPSAVGWLFSTYIFFSFFCGLQVGPIFDAKGPRLLIFLGSVFIVAGTLGLANSTRMSLPIYVALVL